MKYQKIIFSAIFGIFLVLTGCSDETPPGVGGVSTNYPYLISTPQVTYAQSVYDITKYDVTVTLEATGPNPIFSVNLWLTDVTNFFNSSFVDLENVVGTTTWTGSTTGTFSPLSAGDYHIDTIMIKDADPFLDGIVKSGWYFISPISANYTISQDEIETIWDPLSINPLSLNFGYQIYLSLTLPYPSCHSLEK